MKDSKVLKAFLIFSGLLLTFIGGATLFMPVAIKASSGVDLAGNVSVLNDIRASAALILGLAILIISGAFVRKITYTSSLISFLVFLSLGIGRILSILSDGMPVDPIVKATGLEMVLGVLGLVLFMRNREKN